MFFHRTAGCRRTLLFIGSFILISGPVLFSGTLAKAQSDKLSDTALGLIPQNAAFAISSPNLQDAWNDFLTGKLVTRIRAVPYVKNLEAEVERLWETAPGPIAQAKIQIQSPIAQDLIRVSKEMLTDEMFIYGEHDWCEAIEGLMAFQSKMSSVAELGPDAAIPMVVSAIEELTIPTLVIGFRLQDTADFRNQLDTLEAFLRYGIGAAEEARPFIQKLRRADFDDGQALAFTLDTSLIPAEAFEEDDSGMLETLTEKLKDRSISIAVGVNQGCVLLTLSERSDVIQTFGTVESSLMQHPSLEVLRANEPEALRGISFASAEWQESQYNANLGNYFTNLYHQLSGLMDVAVEANDSEVDLDAWKADIERDAAWLDDQIQALVPAWGDALSYSYRVNGGFEGYAYNWSSNPLMENATPLSLLRHAGTNPILLWTAKQRPAEQVDEICDYLLEHGPAHIRRIIELGEKNDRDRESMLKTLETGWPILVDAVSILRNKIGPAMDEHEALVAIAANWMLPELPDMPPPSRPLPLPELSVVWKLRDRELFLSGCDELYRVFDRVVELVRELEPSAIPAEYSIPRPMEAETARGTSYFYRELNDAVPLDGFAPQLLVTDELVLLGYSERHLADLANSRVLTTRPAWMQANSPTAMMSLVDFAAFFSAVRPWLEYGISLNFELNEPVGDFGGMLPAPTGNDLLQIWDCFASIGKAATTVQIQTGGETVSRWIWVEQ